MGKGFNNYMTKKFFHPGSKDNIKRVWMAQQKTNYEKQKQDDLLSQYQKEQEMYKNRALLGDEKAKLGLSFMYDAPPGLKKKEVEEKETEVKFEWQRKYNAPRENYAKDDETIRDQPFGIEVRNVRCIKCRKWGHVNTDRICPLFNQDLTAEPPQPSTSASSLLEGLQSDGFTLKKSILGKMGDNADTEKILESEDEDDPEVQFLKSLNPKQRKKLLKKLNKLQSGKKDGRVSKEKKKKRKKHKKKSGSSDEDSESDTKSDRKRRESSSEASDNEHKRHSMIQSSQRKDQRSKRGESPRSRGHSSNLKEPSRSRRSDLFERSRVQESSLESRGNRERNRRSRSPNPRERRTADVGKGKHRTMRRSLSSSSDTDGASYRRPQRPRSRSTERGERPRRRSDSRERNNYSSRQRRSHSRERRRSRSHDRRRRSDS